MGKKKNKKKDAEKKEKLKAKKAAKLNKKQTKKQKKAAKELGEEHIDSLVKEFNVTNMDEDKTTNVVIKENVSRPGPRCYANFTALPTGEICLFGGEYFDGKGTYNYNDLYFYNPTTETWRTVTSDYCPAPRSSHQAVVYREHMYIFAGEFATTNQFYHYKDFWRFHVGTNKWELLEAKGGPSQRSGHRMVVWRNFILVFGGFYDVSREMKYYDDLHVFCTRELKWRKMEFDPLKPKPSARSGCGFAAHPSKDEVFLYGGYTEVRVGRVLTRGRCSSEIWRLKLNPGRNLKDLKMSWSRLSRKGSAPVERNSFACTVHKRRMLFFGGCDDNDLQEEIQSDFFNDVHAFDMDLGRFFKIELRGNKSKKKKNKKKKKAKKVKDEEESGTTVIIHSDSDDDDEEEDDDDDFDEEKILDGYDDLDDNKFYYMVDGVIMEMDLDNLSDEEEEEQVEQDDDDKKKESDKTEVVSGTDNDKDDNNGNNDGKPKAIEDDEEIPTLVKLTDDEKVKTDDIAIELTNEDDKVDDKIKTNVIENVNNNKNKNDNAKSSKAEITKEEPNAIEPRKRFNSSICSSGNNLYVWGGMWEEKDKRFTLDDIWALDMVKLKEWKPLLESTDAGLKWQGSDDEWEDMEDEDDDGENGGGNYGDDGDDMTDEDDYDSQEEEKDAETLEKEKKEFEAMSKDEKAVVLALKQLKKLKRSGFVFGGGSSRRSKSNVETSNLMHTLGLSDALSTPDIKEKLRDFFLRTADHWLQVTANNEIVKYGRMSGKELRRLAFEACEKRFTTMKPLLDRLDILEQEQRLAEAKASAMSGKQMKKKKKGLTREEKKALKKAKKKKAKELGE